MTQNLGTPCIGDGQVAGKRRHFRIPASIISFLFAVQAILTILPPDVKAAPETGPPPVPKLLTGNLHALVVGVSAYRDPKIPKLELADKDARAFGEFLETQKKVFKETQVTFLLNEKATKSEVEKYLYYTMHNAGKNDTVILFFSGHGAYDPMRPKEFLFLTHDSNPQYLRATAVRMSGLEFLEGIEAERVLIIADACYAGGFSDIKPKTIGPSVDLFLSEVRSSSGTAVITSGKEGQLSWEVPNLETSVFTHNLIEGLKGKADKDHDGVVTLNEAYQYAYHLTRQVTRGHQHPQFEGKIVGPFPLSFVGPPVPPSELKKQLLLATKTGDEGKTDRLLNDGADVNTRDDENNTPLIISAGQGHAGVTRLLLAEGADLEARNQYRLTALGAACEKGHSETVKLLLENGGNVNTKTTEGLTPLVLASRNGNSDVVKLLLAAGADVKSRTNSGKTPLLTAASEGHYEIVKLLLDHGADVNAKDLEGATAWAEAARHGHGPIVEFLVRKGADVHSRRGTFLDNQLILAALCNDIDRAKELVALGADPDATSESGDTVLALSSGLGHLSIIEFLIRKGVNVNLRTYGEGTPLLLAARSGRVKVVALLSNGGALVDATDADGNTALLAAAQHGHPNVVRHLLARKADVNARNESGGTPLMLAAEHGHAEIVRMLIAAGADTKAVDCRGDNVLTLSAQNGHEEIVRLVCTGNVDVNAQNHKGSTALILAAHSGHAGVVKVLLERGADAFIQDWEGKTALVLASEYGRTSVLDILVRSKP